MLVLGLGCGSSKSSSPDAAPTSDAPGNALCGPAQGSATVTVTRHGVPASGVAVVYQCPDGRWADVVRTDADGRATVDVVADSMLTIGGPWSNDPNQFEYPTLYTIMGVQPGDQLRVEPEAPAHDLLAQRDLTLPGAVSGATNYQVRSGCDHFDQFTSYPASVSVLAFSDCENVDNTARAWIVAGDSTGPLAVTYADFGATSPEPVVLPDWSSFLITPTVGVENAPAEAAAIETATMNAMRGEQRFSDGHPTNSPAPFSGGVSGMAFYTFPQDVASELEFQVRVGYDDAQAPNGSAVFYRREPFTASHTIDMGAAALPRLASAALDTAAPARPQVSWTTDGDLSVADAAVVEISWLGDVQEQWLVLAPASTTAPLVLPELPAIPDAAAPPAGATFDPPSVRFIEADWLDFAAIKQTGLPGLTDVLQLYAPDIAVRAPAGTHLLRASVF